MDDGTLAVKEPRILDAAGTPIRSLGHVALRCFDAEETRRFYEDFLGLEFTAALPLKTDRAGNPVDAMRIFFRLADGDFLIFYDVPDDINPDLYEPLGPADAHIALTAASEAEWKIWCDRVASSGVEFFGPIDHDFAHSIYFTDPNGLTMEILYRVPQHDEILDREQSHSKEDLAKWTVQTAGRKAAFGIGTANAS